MDVARSRAKLGTMLVLATVLGLAIVNAAVFAVRYMYGTVNYSGAATPADGAACTGFFTGTLTLPDGSQLSAGTNSNAVEYNTTSIEVQLSTKACTWRLNNVEYDLYQEAYVTIHPKSGTWYYEDILGFGYVSSLSNPPTAYVTIKVEETTISQATDAKLIVYKVSGGSATPVGALDLKQAGETLSVTMNANEALRLDLNITYSGSANTNNGNTGTETFKLAFYVSQSSETPP